MDTVHLLSVDIPHGAVARVINIRHPADQGEAGRETLQDLVDHGLTVSLSQYDMGTLSYIHWKFYTCDDIDIICQEGREAKVV